MANSSIAAFKSRFRHDRSGRARFVFQTDDGSRCQRFQNAQHAILSRAGVGLSPSAWLVASLVALEGIANAADLELAYMATPARHFWRGHWRICWTRAEHGQDARALSLVTVQAASAIRELLPFSDAAADLVRFLQKEGIYPADITCSLDEVVRDAVVWLQYTTSPVLHGHIAGENMLTALPLNAIARDVTARPLLSVEPAEANVEGPCPHTALSLGLEAALLGRRSAIGADDRFLYLLGNALRAPKGFSPPSRRSKIRRQLAGLSSGLADVCEITALLFAYATELATSGTEFKRVLSPDTPYAYVQAIGKHLLDEFQGKRISDLSEEAYGEAFTRLVSLVAGHSPSEAGLRGFHRFLTCWWEVPALPAGVFKAEAEPTVSANVIWPHESSLVDLWLLDASSDRACAQARVALAIGRECKVRAQEVMTLRCRSISIEDDRVVIEIARDISDGKEKTKEGRRRVSLHDPGAIQVVSDWLKRRSLENALPGDYLFGDPNDAGRICERGRTYYLMNRLPKVATGDPTVSFHTLRHTQGSVELEHLLLTSADAEVNPLDQLAAEAGHVGAHVTARHYGHLFELAILSQVDRAILPELSASSIAGLLGCSSDSVRQRLSRGIRALQASTGCPDRQARARVVLSLFQNMTPPHTDLMLAALCDTDLPIRPVLFPPKSAPALVQVWDTLQDLSIGYSAESTALRQAIPLSWVQEIAAQAGRFADTHGQSFADQPDLDLHGLEALRNHSGRLLGFRPSFLRSSSPLSTYMTKGLQNVDKVLLRDACKYWERNLGGERLCLQLRSPGVSRFLQAIKDAGVPVNALSLRCSGREKRAGAGAATVDQLALAVHAIFGASVPITRLKSRPGRSGCWLLVRSSMGSTTLRGRSVSMARFHSHMLAAAIWLHFFEKEF